MKPAASLAGISGADGMQSLEHIQALLHDIRGAIWIAVGTLDVTLAEDNGRGCDRKCVQEALDSCLQAVALMDDLQRCFVQISQLGAIRLRGSDLRD